MQTFTQKMLSGVAIVAAVALAILFFYYAIEPILIVFAAILFAVFLRGLADWFSKRTGLGAGLSLAITTISLFVSIALVVYLLAPDVLEQIKQLQKDLPATFARLQERLNEYSWGKMILMKLGLSPQEAAEGGAAIAGGELDFSQIGKFLGSTFNVLINFVVFFLLGIYLAAEPRVYTGGVLYLFPKEKRDRAAEVITAIGHTLRWWLVGKFGSMLVIGVMTFIGLKLLGVPLSLTLGLFAALMTFIPNLGPLIAVIPAALLALADNPVTALYVLALYYGIQVIESYLITPNIERQTVELPPGLTIAAQLFFAVLVGGLGLVLATPLVAVGIVLIQMLYVEDVLGDDIKTPNEKTN